MLKGYQLQCITDLSVYCNSGLTRQCQQGDFHLAAWHVDTGLFTRAVTTQMLLEVRQQWRVSEAWFLFSSTLTGW